MSANYQKHSEGSACCESGHASRSAMHSPDTIYTCPMHPQVRQAGPGTCPICGMALEPLMPTETEDDGDLRSVRRKLWISAAKRSGVARRAP